MASVRDKFYLIMLETQKIPQSKTVQLILKPFCTTMQYILYFNDYQVIFHYYVLAHVNG